MDPAVLELTMEEIAASWRHLAINGRVAAVDAVLGCLLAYCPDIQSLTLCQHVFTGPFDVTDRVLGAVEELRLLETSATQHMDIGAILDICPNVKHLHLGECDALVCPVTFDEISKLRHLKKLSLYFASDYKYSTSSLREYLQDQPLEVLDLPDCQLSGYLVLDIIEPMTQGTVIWRDKSCLMSDPQARASLVESIRAYDAEREREQARRRWQPPRRPRVLYRNARQAHYTHIDYYYVDYYYDEPEYESDELDYYDEELRDFIVDDDYSNSEDGDFEPGYDYSGLQGATDDSDMSYSEDDDGSEEPEAYDD